MNKDKELIQDICFWLIYDLTKKRKKKKFINKNKLIFLLKAKPVYTITRLYIHIPVEYIDIYCRKRYVVPTILKYYNIKDLPLDLQRYCMYNLSYNDLSKFIKKLNKEDREYIKEYIGVL